MDPLTLLAAALATFRLSLAISQEEGPFGAFTKLRGALDPDQKTWLGRGVNCLFCVSFWVAWPVLSLASLHRGRPFVNGLALSGAAVLMKRWLDRR